MSDVLSGFGVSRGVVAASGATTLNDNELVMVDGGLGTVSVAAEARQFAELARDRGVRMVGTMIEVPAAALRARSILDECDFVSLGTNDLAQYAFAADRQLGQLGDLLDPWQPALLELVRLATDAGLSAGKPVGVCGEAASDACLAPVLVGLGVTRLSMAPGSLAPVRASLATHTLEDCQEMAKIALDASDAASARESVRHRANVSE
jgi:phosphoenolpyruvate-protein phosphotransferase (PTS system enzyme I)